MPRGERDSVQLPNGMQLGQLQVCGFGVAAAVANAVQVIVAHRRAREIF